MVAHHFWVVSLSKVYHIPIWMRDFFRMTFQDYWHMQTRDATCQSHWSHAPFLLEPFSSRRHRSTDSLQPPSSSLPSSSVLASDAVEFHQASSGSFSDIFACMHRASQSDPPSAISIVLAASVVSAIFRTFLDLHPWTLILSRLRHLPNLLRPQSVRPQSVDSQPPLALPSSKPSLTSIRQLPASVGSSIVQTFSDSAIRYSLPRFRQGPSARTFSDAIRQLAASIRAFADVIG
jgi:hypothetical protein